MSESAKIRNDQTLSDLKQALHRFEHDLQSVLTASQSEIVRTQASIDQRVRQWQGQVQRADSEYRGAQAALRLCRARSAGRPTSCISQERAVDRAEMKLNEAQRRLDRTKKWQLSLDAAADQYRRHAARLNNLANNHSPKTRAFLDRVLIKVAEYTPATSSSDGQIPLVSAIAQTLVAPLPGDEPAADSKESYQPDEYETFYCGNCRREQRAEQGERCIDCGRVTVSWHYNRESEAEAMHKWEHVNPSHGYD